jgi:PIN domain nuclease of toxin-antitoxin system
MDFLLDTNAFLWFSEDNPKLSPTAKKYIEDPNNYCYMSIASLWEISIKISLNKINLKISFEKFFRLIEDNGFKVLPITFEHTLQVSKLIFHHKDPFDRLIISQAIVEDVPIITSDEIFNSYKIKCIW